MTIHQRRERAEAAVQNARERLTRLQESRGPSRWGEARRFAGRSAGLYLERLDKARAALDKAYARLEKLCAN